MLKKIIVIMFSFHLVVVSHAETGIEEEEPKITFPSLPLIADGKQRLFIVRTTGDVSKANIERTANQIAGRVATVLLLGGYSPLADKINAFSGSTHQYQMVFDLFSYKDDQLTSVASLKANTVGYYVDLDKSMNIPLVFGLSYFGYEPDIGKINFQFDGDKTHVLVMGRQEESVDKDQLKQFNDTLRIKAEEEDIHDFSPKSASGKWGISILKLENADTQFCESLRTQPLNEDQLKKAILGYSRNFVKTGSKLKSNVLFNLACMAVSRSKSIDGNSKKSIRRAKKATKELLPFINHVTENERQRQFIDLKKQ